MFERQSKPLPDGFARDSGRGSDSGRATHRRNVVSPTTSPHQQTTTSQRLQRVAADEWFACLFEIERCEARMAELEAGG
jgi:hypothetical protein